MNINQTKRYGWLVTYTDIARRYCDCPHCSYRVSGTRRGPGANALALAARLKGQIMTHIRANHPEVLE